MNRYKLFVGIIGLAELILVLLCNGVYLSVQNHGEDRIYRVEANRVAQEIQNQNMTEAELADMDLSAYDTIVRVGEFHPEEVCHNDYVVEEAGGRLYRIEYRAEQKNGALIYINVALLAMVLITAAVLIYVYQKVLRPFHAMSNLSYELARGNLAAPVKEEKSKLFGRFLWGMDMLREKLEDNRKKELEFQRSRKTLILSLSHDIKTPLSSIELYARALSENLYDTREKRDQAIDGIARNAKEIKNYVDEIVTASREDFLNLEVVPGEFYLREVMDSIREYYRDKLSVIHTEFTVEDIPDCLLKGDENRLIEVLQNIMENAIKYGDGRSIRIYGEDEEDCKLIHVENTGCGLKPEELPSLFDSFYRGSNSHGILGNGLGLYICKNLMEKMDGEVFAQMWDEGFCVTVVIRKA